MRAINFKRKLELEHRGLVTDMNAEHGLVAAEKDNKWKQLEHEKT